MNKIHKIIGFSLVFLAIIIFPFLLKLPKLSRPNVILITIDALRANHLGCYGYQRNTSPNIDRLVKEGTIFLNCFATSSGTIYSLVGLLTGRYLAVDKKDYVFFDNILDTKFTTLAEYLKNLGYYTVAFINNAHLKVRKGFEQGFDVYKNYNKNAEILTNEVINFLNNNFNEKPFFIWIHYLDAHVPYSPSEEYFKFFENDRLYKENNKILSLCPEEYPNPFTSRGHIPRIAFHKDNYSLNYYIACYDAEIFYTDFYLGKLLKNINDNTIVILTADHGESLGEHNYYFTHEENIYDEVLHVPLIIKDNRNYSGGKRISKIVSSVDIVPTILSKIDSFYYFFKKSKFDGVDLNRIVKAKDIKRKYIYSYFPLSTSIRDIKKNIKYILSRNGKEELYFLPDENNNHINNDSLNVNHIKEELRRNLKMWLREYPVGADKNSKRMHLDEEAKELLRSLGYLQ